MASQSVYENGEEEGVLVDMLQSKGRQEKEKSGDAEMQREVKIVPGDVHYGFC